MRSAWFDHVRKTREKESRGKKVKVTHREAMKIASASWPAIKAKLQRKAEREKKKLKLAKKKAGREIVSDFDATAPPRTNLGGGGLSPLLGVVVAARAWRRCPRGRTSPRSARATGP